MDLSHVVQRNLHATDSGREIPGFRGEAASAVLVTEHIAQS
jgi:hypothetical protein